MAMLITILCKFSLTKAVFTLGRNMVSLIANETCLVMRSVHIRQSIVQIMVETGLFWAWLKQPHDQTKRVQNGGWMRRVGKCPIKWKNWVKCLVEIWADEQIQRQLLAMSGKQNIWEKIATKRNDNSYKHYKLLILSKTEYLVPKKVQMLSPS